MGITLRKSVPLKVIPTPYKRSSDHYGFWVDMGYSKISTSITKHNYKMGTTNQS
jgi:hypothetical protein